MGQHIESWFLEHAEANQAGRRGSVTGTARSRSRGRSSALSAKATRSAGPSTASLVGVAHHLLARDPWPRTQPFSFLGQVVHGTLPPRACLKLGGLALTSFFVALVAPGALHPLIIGAVSCPLVALALVAYLRGWRRHVPWFFDWLQFPVLILAGISSVSHLDAVGLPFAAAGVALFLYAGYYLLCHLTRHPVHDDRAQGQAPTKDEGLAGADVAGAALPDRATGAASTTPGPEAGGRWDPFAAGALTDLTALAHEDKLDPIAGRDKTIERILEIVGQVKPASAALIGRPGTGKTALVDGLAISIAHDPDDHRRVLMLDGERLKAGTGYSGDVEAHWVAVKAELERPGTIFAVDEAHQLLAGADTMAADTLKPGLSGRKMSMLALSTEEEWQPVRRNGALRRRFAEIHIDEPTVPEAEAMLAVQSKEIEAHNKVSVGSDIIEYAAYAAKRYIKDQALPGSAVAILASAASKAQRRGEGAVSEELVAEAIKDVAHVTVALGDELQSLRHLTVGLRERVIGHDAAIERVADAIRAYRMGISKSDLPLSIYVAGPSGVGKSSLAHALADLLGPGNPDALMRIDGSTLKNPELALAKFLGAPPGYRDHGEGGTFSRRLARAQVVLLDEAEKAHPDVFESILLPILGEGDIEDNDGTKLSFSDKVVLLTSNLGAERGDGANDRMELAAERHFGEAVWGRIRLKLCLHYVDRVAIDEIFNGLYLQLVERVRESQSVELGLSPALKAHLVGQGLDSNGGIRGFSLTDVENAFTSAKLDDDIHEGDCLVADLAADGSVCFLHEWEVEKVDISPRRSGGGEATDEAAEASTGLSDERRSGTALVTTSRPQAGVELSGSSGRAPVREVTCVQEAGSLWHALPHDGEVRDEVVGGRKLKVVPMLCNPDDEVAFGPGDDPRRALAFRVPTCEKCVSLVRAGAV